MTQNKDNLEQKFPIKSKSISKKLKIGLLQLLFWLLLHGVL